MTSNKGIIMIIQAMLHLKGNYKFRIIRKEKKPISDLSVLFDKVLYSNFDNKYFGRVVACNNSHVFLGSFIYNKHDLLEKFFYDKELTIPVCGYEEVDVTDSYE